LFRAAQVEGGTGATERVWEKKGHIALRGGKKSPAAAIWKKLERRWSGGGAGKADRGKEGGGSVGSKKGRRIRGNWEGTLTGGRMLDFVPRKAVVDVRLRNEEGKRPEDGAERNPGVGKAAGE